MTRILIVLTSHSELGDTGNFTGFHYEEMTTPYYAFIDAGYHADLASIAGGQPPHDPSSLDDEPEKWAQSVKRFKQDSAAMKALSDTYSIHQINASRYDAIYLPGGHGTMWDFPESKPLADVIGNLYDHGKIIASVCHGAAGLVNVRDNKTNKPLVKGRKINSFTDEEEREVGLDDVVPFLLESRLRELGADFNRGKIFGNFTIQDGQIITGQNPASLNDLSDKILSSLRKYANRVAA